MSRPGRAWLLDCLAESAKAQMANDNAAMSSINPPDAEWRTRRANGFRSQDILEELVFDQRMLYAGLEQLWTEVRRLGQVALCSSSVMHSAMANINSVQAGLQAERLARIQSEQRHPDLRSEVVQLREDFQSLKNVVQERCQSSEKAIGACLAQLRVNAEKEENEEEEEEEEEEGNSRKFEQLEAQVCQQDSMKRECGSLDSTVTIHPDNPEFGDAVKLARRRNSRSRRGSLDTIASSAQPLSSCWSNSPDRVYGFHDKASRAVASLSCFSEDASDSSPGRTRCPDLVSDTGASEEAADSPPGTPLWPDLVFDTSAFQSAKSLSMSWSIKPSGTMHHVPTGLTVSPDAGVTYEGYEFHLSPEDVEIDEDSRLGAGSGGVVKVGRIKSTNAVVAVKTIQVENKDKREQLLNELKGLVQARGCPYLVQMYTGFCSKQEAAVYVVLEYLDLGSLVDLLTRLNWQGTPPHHLSCMAVQILKGLKHLHSRHFLHRDIKPGNILHNRKGEVKLTDFGIAKALDTSQGLASTFVGTAAYISPERCLGEDYSFASDIWSLGMVTYELATGTHPFKDVGFFPNLWDQLCEKPEPRLDATLFPSSLCDFVALCLARDPLTRPVTYTLAQHQFVTEGVCSTADLAQWFSSVPQQRGD